MRCGLPSAIGLLLFVVGLAATAGLQVRLSEGMGV